MMHNGKMKIKVKCIKDVYYNNLTDLKNCENEDEELLSYPIQRLFTKGKIYEVNVTDNGEWRTKDDTCSRLTPYNHILSDTGEWFTEHFQVI